MSASRIFSLAVCAALFLAPFAAQAAPIHPLAGPLAGPQVVAALPAPNAAAAPLDGGLSATFDLDLDPATVSAANVALSGSLSGSLPAAVAYREREKTIELLPARGLLPGERVTAVVTGAVHGLDAAPVTPYAWQFLARALGGTGTFSQPPALPVGSPPRNLEAGDLNGDGFVDLLVSYGESQNFIGVLLNDQAGGFAAQVLYATDTWPYASAPIDIDRDGDLDVLTINHYANTLRLYKNDAAGGLSAAGTYSAYSGPHGLVVADFNLDGWPDAAVVSEHTIAAAIYLNTHTGGLSSPAPISLPAQPVNVTAGDFNNDGAPDLAVAYAGSGAISLLANQGNGTFSAPQTVSAAVSNLAVADLDGDGWLDLAGAGTSANTLQVLLNDRHGGFAAPVSTPAPATPMAVKAADFNGDGHPDLAVTAWTSNQALIFLNDGSGAFASAAPYVLGTNPYWLAPADLNNDGAIDLAVSVLNASSLAILRNDPGASLSISGRVADFNNRPLAGVTVSDGSGHTAQTGADGAYFIGGLSDGFYTIGPVQDKNFRPVSPTQRNISLDGASAHSVNFKGYSTRNPVILLPGVMGSRLTNTPNTSAQCQNQNPPRPKKGEIWITQIALDLLSTPKLAPDFESLTFRYENGAVSQLNQCDIITATGIFDSLLLNFYGDITTKLENLGFRVVKFPYDWRYSLNAAVPHLQGLITALTLEPGVDRVILLGHSMGGMLARAYIADATRAARVEQVITAGSPYWGAPKMAYAMRSGDPYIMISEPFLAPFIRPLIRNSPGTMELLPSRAYFSQVSGYYYDQSVLLPTFEATRDFFTGRGQNEDLMNNAATFHAALDDFRGGLNGVEYHVLAQNAVKTMSQVVESAKYNRDKNKYDVEFGFNRYLMGDGTVPQYSARLHNYSVDVSWQGSAEVCTVMDTKADHGGLMKDEKFQNKIFSILGTRAGDRMWCQETKYAPPGAAAAAGPRVLQVSILGGARVEVRDQLNRYLGPDAAHLLVNEIPGASYDVAEYQVILTLPVENTYTLQIETPDPAQLEVDVTDFQGASEDAELVPQQRALFVDVPSPAAGWVTLALDPAAGLDTLQLGLDPNHDGTPDGTVPVTSLVDAGQIQDLVPPVTTIQVSGAHDPLFPGFYTGPLTVALPAADSGSGVLFTYYSLDQGATWHVYSTPLELSAEAAPVLLAYSMDKAGNQEAPLVALRLRPYQLLVPVISR